MNEITDIKPDKPIQEIDIFTDTRDILANARREAHRRKFADWFMVDVDAHHGEVRSWSEIIEYIEDPVLRDQARNYQKDKMGLGGPPYGLNGDLGLRYQDVGGRIPHQADVREPVPGDVHRDVTITRRAMDSFCLNTMIIFPTPMLFLGMHPQTEMEVLLCRAYSKWLLDRVCSKDDGIKTLVPLPFNTPKASEKMVEEFAGKPGVLGFSIPSTRYKPVHHNDYMRLYAMIEETGMPLGFHAGYHWSDPSLATVNRFLGMHALGFVWCNMIHMTNWILNGIPVRFPKLKTIWIESGLAWVPFLMQRLDDQYLMRTSEAPLLKGMPSDYMRQHCWYTTQPMERTDMGALETTLRMINAETQLLFSSDWPHFDFNLPSMIYELPFLSEQAKRNILGLNAASIFNLQTS